MPIQLRESIDDRSIDDRSETLVFVEFGDGARGSFEGSGEAGGEVLEDDGGLEGGRDVGVASS